MRKVICTIPLIAMRKQPDQRSEMTSQMLFGEKAQVLEEQDEWLKIATLHDSYTAWINKKGICFMDNDDQENRWITMCRIFSAIQSGDTRMFIPAGAEIPEPDDSGHFSLAGQDYRIIDPLPDEQESEQKTLTSLAIQFMNAPYLWGGRNIMGIDCSGFVQIIYKIAGIALPRDAKDQAEKGNIVEAVNHALPCDLAFFKNQKGAITHVGMLIMPGKIIHASGCVREDVIDEKGIYNKTTGKYTHALHSIKHILHQGI